MHPLSLGPLKFFSDPLLAASRDLPLPIAFPQTPGGPAGLRAQLRLRSLAALLACVVVSLLTASPACALTGTATVTAVLGPATPYFTDDVTATVTVASASAPVPTGSITWDTDGGGHQSAPLVNGVARINLQFFAPGAHTFDYSYSGDSAYAAVAQQTLGFSVADRPFTMYGSDHTVNTPGVSNIEYVALDSHQNLIFTQQYQQNKLVRVDPKGVTTVIPTTGLSSPTNLVVDKQDNIYIADTGNTRVVEVSAAGAQSVLPITGLTSVTALAFDPAYQNLYVVDQSAATIVIYNLAAQTQTSFTPGISPLTAVAVDPAGDVYYAQGANQVDYGHLYRRDTAGNVLEIFAGPEDINGLSLDARGNLYILANGFYVHDTQGHLTELTPSGGYATSTAAPRDSRGRIYLPTGSRVSVFTPGITGDAGYSYLTSQAFDPAFPLPNVGGETVTLDYQAPYQQLFTNVAIANGALLQTPNYPPETGATNSIASVPLVLQAYLFGVPVLPGLWSTSVTIATTDGATHTNLVYGVGVAEDFAMTPGDITPGSPGVSSIGGVATDGNGNTYISDTQANQVLKVSSGASATVPFTGLNAPTQLAVDGLGAVTVLDSGSSRILRVDAQGNQSVAFDLGAQTALTSLSAFAMDGGDNLYIAGLSAGGQAALYYIDTLGDQLPLAQNIPLPSALAFDGFGYLYGVETAGGNLRRYDQGITPTLIATGLTQPSSLTVDPGGTAFVTGPAGSGITIVHPDGTTTPYPSAALANASAITSDGQGNLFVGDTTEKQIFGIARVQGRTLTYDFGNVPLNTTATYTGQLFNAGNAVTVPWGLSLFSSETALATDPNECPGTQIGNNTPLAAGGYCDLNTTFTPGFLGSMSDNYYVVERGYGTFLDLNLTGNGVTPVGAPTLSPGSLNFGNVIVNTTSGVLGFQVLNNNPTALTISSIAVSGPNAAQFSETNTCTGVTLQSNNVCAILITFTPSAVGLETATVTVTDNASTPTTTLSIEGTGVAAPTPSVSVSPAATTFPATVFGSSSAAQTLLVTNSGSAAATLSSITLGGANATSFALTGNCGATLAVNASCTVTAVFTPTAASQTFTATVLVASNDPSSPATATLTGTSTAAPVAAATLTPSTLSFPSETVGTASAAQTVTLTNTGNTTLGIASIAVTGAGAASFPQTNSCGATLAAGASCTIQVIFDPAEAGNLTAALSVQFSGASQAPSIARAHDLTTPAPLTTSLSGTGVAAVTPVPIATLTPEALTYSATAGSTSTAQIATLTNSGTAALNISGIMLTGANASAFTMSANSCGATLAVNASCTLSVMFAPASSGSFSASISVTDNAAGSPQTTTLTGTGAAVPVAADFAVAASPAMQSVTAGSAATYTIPVTSSGGSFTDAVTLSASGLPPGAKVTFSPASVTPGTAGAQSTMTVQTAAQQAASRRESPPWPSHRPLSGSAATPVFAALLLLIPGWRARRRWNANVSRAFFTGAGCLLILFGMMATITGCGAGFALPQTPVGATTYTITVTGTSGSVQHNTTVQITVR
jgi:sugar lactone lactonase YvrE